MEEVAELKVVYWLEITGSLELHKLLLNRSYSAYLVYKLLDEEERHNLDVAMAARVRILSKGEEEEELVLWEKEGHVYIDGDRSEGTQTESEWIEIKLGEFINRNDFRVDGSERVEARLFESECWKSGLIVKGMSFRLNN